jgi:hypothetical protein
MELLAFVAFALLVAAWLTAPAAPADEAIRLEPRAVADAGA